MSGRRGGGRRDYRATRDAHIDQVDPFVAVVGPVLVARVQLEVDSFGQTVGEAGVIYSKDRLAELVGVGLQDPRIAPNSET